ncbi:uncharacterized protein LOC112344379 isoform X2 [Selaginella moellendorffii]|uniref:uncharacterized protein LOC112344379 isoform X2 n=1 Tax=Selaginella moellendorffii TaxID=88036 RepID=UPI000D1D11C3|nr:uncharacterized protein LOC112344379 isoform X2 [Selaginella moellendorffii]|eukprot:XP_024524784.1 uncharacterized protein LOC112344379 isoform X2 [Selaginella moellendorffii]
MLVRKLEKSYDYYSTCISILPHCDPTVKEDSPVDCSSNQKFISHRLSRNFADPVLEQEKQKCLSLGFLLPLPQREHKKQELQAAGHDSVSKMILAIWKRAGVFKRCAVELVPSRVQERSFLAHDVHITRRSACILLTLSGGRALLLRYSR